MLRALKKMSYSNRLFLYAPLVVLLGLAIAAALRWEIVSGGLETWFRLHNGHEIAPGVTLHFATESVTGFPFNVDAVLTNVTFEVRSARTSASWHTDGFAMHELTFGRTQQVYEAAGTQTVSWIDADGGNHRLVFVPGSLMASAILSGRRLVRFDLDLNGIGSREISGARLQLHFRKARDRDAIEVAASAEQIQLAPVLQMGFGTVLQNARLTATLTPAAPLGRLFEGGDIWDRALEAWRCKNGAIRFDTLETNWNGVQTHAAGSLGLDDSHILAGGLALDAKGMMRTPEGRLAQAIVQLTKDRPGTARRYSLSVASGIVSLRVTKSPQMSAAAGSIGPLY